MATTSEKLVGPVVRDVEIADALVEAIERDNPGQEIIVKDEGGYTRIHTRLICRVTRQSLEEALGRPFKLSQLEPSLAAFAGRISVRDEEVIWYLERED
ncbi:MAG TPA: MmoB/DmpM family protein [Chloroflexia bacterium]|nr:MmoB/DmpM family protein [Chloroflexia bacterium]